MTYVVVAYDTPSDRRRNEMRQRLRGYLFHAQKSVFEGHLRGRDIARLRRILRHTAHRREDAVRLFQLCERCAARGETLAGQGPVELPAAVIAGEE